MAVIMKHIQNDTARRTVMALTTFLMPALILLLALTEALKTFVDEFKRAWSYWFSKEYCKDFKDCWKEPGPGHWWE